MSPVGRLLQQHPHWGAARHVLATLTAAGHQALLAGGCVRDACLGIVAQDLDIATSALPDEVISLFPRTVEVGKSFGVVRVLESDADLEVATFRRDGAYEDGRRPTAVAFTDAKEDALRRDFTVNALFYDVDADRVDDHVEGMRDLHLRCLRTVGEAERRFGEDHLRLLRAVRFAVQLDFAIDANTWREVQACAASIGTVSGERVRDELAKMLKFGGAKAPRLFAESRLQENLFSELAPFADLLRDHADALAGIRGSGVGFVFSRWLAPLAHSRPLFDFAPILRRLKLSRGDEKATYRRLDLVAHPEKIRAASLGEQIQSYDDAVIREAWDFLEAIAGADPARAKVDAAWRTVRVKETLPKPLINGDDLKQSVRGAVLGETLRATYSAQLEGQFSDRAGALTWANAWTKMK